MSTKIVSAANQLAAQIAAHLLSISWVHLPIERSENRRFGCHSWYTAGMLAKMKGEEIHSIFCPPDWRGSKILSECSGLRPIELLELLPHSKEEPLQPVVCAVHSALTCRANVALAADHTGMKRGLVSLFRCFKPEPEDTTTIKEFLTACTYDSCQMLTTSVVSERGREVRLRCERFLFE